MSDRVTGALDQWAERVGSPPKPAVCARLVQELGSLAPWLLRDEVLEAARERLDEHRRLDTQTPSLPPGSVVALFAQTNDRWRAALRDGFGLPLRWCEGDESSEGLPPGLRRLGEEVLLELQREYGAERTFGLRWADDQGWDLRELNWTCESAWAALAGALHVAWRGGVADPAVTASACRTTTGVRGVERLPEKLAEAQRLKLRRVYVAAEDEGGQALPTLEVRGLRTLRGDRGGHSARALRALLEAQEVEPEPEAPLKSKAKYYQGLVTPERRVEFYARALLPGLVERCAVEGQVGEVQRLVSFVSFNPEACLFAIRALQPKQVLLLCSAESREHEAMVREHLEGWGIKGTFETVDEDDLEAVRDKTREFVGDGRGVVLDVTPGPKVVSVGFVLERPPSARLVYLKHGWASRSLRPGDEQLVVLPVGA